MKQVKVFISLITDDNDYQKEQAADASDTAHRLGMSVQIAYAGNDAVKQTQQLLKVIQDPTQRPDAILVEPVGTGMIRVAEAAAATGVGWGLVNHEADYVAQIRRTSPAPIFLVSTDQEEVGRIQGRQFGALLKRGGGILYIEGPSTGGAARLRTLGMHSTKPADADVKALKGDWTEQSAYNVVKSWLSLSVSRQLNVRVIGCQNDAMALGARKAFQELPGSPGRNEWLSMPFTGCDGVPKTGQEWVRRGLLAATVVIPPTMGLALEILQSAIQSKSQPPERTISRPTSYPSVEELNRRAQEGPVRVVDP